MHSTCFLLLSFWAHWITLINASTYSLYTIIILYMMKHYWCIFIQWLQPAWWTTRIRVRKQTSKVKWKNWICTSRWQPSWAYWNHYLSLPNNLSMNNASVNFPGSRKKLQGYILTELCNTFETSQSASFDH
jgi:hypothetical protein